MSTMVVISPVAIAYRGASTRYQIGDTVTDPTIQARILASGGALVINTSPVAAAVAAVNRLRLKGDDVTAQMATLLALITAATLQSSGAPIALSTTLVGPNTTASQIAIAIPAGETMSFTIDAAAQVIAVGVGGSEALGDCYSIGGRLTLKNVSGTVVQVTNKRGLPEIDADASMVDCTINVAGSAGNAIVQFTNGALLGTGAQVQYTVNVQARVL